LRLGSVALNAQTHQVRISLMDIVEQLGVTEEEVIGNLPTTLAEEDVQLFDFEVLNLANAGDSAEVVIPLFTALGSNPDYIKFTVESGWESFAQDGLNRLFSASALFGMGICPAIDSNLWVPGLTEGLMIEDGGPNDADRFDAGEGLNGRILDPGAVVYDAPEALPGPSTGALTNQTGGSTNESESGLEVGLTGRGSIGFGGVMPLALMLLAARRRVVLSLVGGLIVAPTLGQAEVPTQGRNYASFGLLSGSLQPGGQSEGLVASGEGSFGWKLALGRTFGEHFSTELSYTHAGAATLVSADGSSNPYPDARLMYSAPALAVAWHLNPPASQWNVFARTGLAKLRANAEDTPDGLVRKYNSDAQLHLGAGVSWKLSNKHAVVLSHDSYDKDAQWTGIGMNMQSTGALVERTIVDCSLQQPIVYTSQFNALDDRLLADDEAMLYFISKNLYGEQKLHIDIEGYARSGGSAEENLALSEQRVQEVLQMVGNVRQKSSRWKVQWQAFGEGLANTDSTKPEDTAQNRRVDLHVRCADD